MPKTCPLGVVSRLRYGERSLSDIGSRHAGRPRVRGSACRGARHPSLPCPAALTSQLLVDRKQAVPPPADGGKPGARPDHRRRRGRGRDGLPPPVEPQRRRAGIQAAFFLAVFPAIEQHVNQAVAHLARRGERPGVIPVAPDAPSPAEGAVDARATRMVTPRRPRPSARVSSASTMRWRWSSCTLKWRIRKPWWEAAASARRTAGKARAARRQRTARPLRRVTCTGCAAMCAGRARCGTPGRRPGVSLRPAPVRRPPHVRG